MSKTISTEITGDIPEHHFRCMKHHEISILAPVGEELVKTFNCPIERCYALTTWVGSNNAEVGKS